MSIAITSTLAKQAVQTSAAVDSAAINMDFASLLLSNLIIGTDVPSVPANKTGETSTDSTLAIDTNPQEAAQLLASLGLIPSGTEQKSIEGNAQNAALSVETGVSSAISKNKVSSDPLTTLPAIATSTVLPGTTPNAGTNDHTDLPSILPVDGKPAKFAAQDQPLLKTEPPATSALPNDLSASTPGISNAAPNTSGHTSNPSINNTASLKIETPVRDQTWASDFSQKIVWLVSHDKQTAQLTLNPPQMGPIEISLNLSKDSASAFFVSANPEVRDAIETALPRLREMLAGAGIELGQANVGAESFRQPQSGNDEARQGTPRWIADNAILVGENEGGASGQTVMGHLGNGLVNTFA